MSVETFIPKESNALLGTMDIEVFGWNSLFPDSRRAASPCQRLCSVDQEVLSTSLTLPSPSHSAVELPLLPLCPELLQVFRVSGGLQI